jgi:hypothetical protein
LRIGRRDRRIRAFDRRIKKLRGDYLATGASSVAGCFGRPFRPILSPIDRPKPPKPINPPISPPRPDSPRRIETARLEAETPSIALDGRILATGAGRDALDGPIGPHEIRRFGHQLKKLRGDYLATGERPTCLFVSFFVECMHYFGAWNRPDSLAVSLDSV